MKNKKLTIAECCLKYGVGAYNIDACRIGIPEEDLDNYNFNNNGNKRLKKQDGENTGAYEGGWKVDKTERVATGRFPSNFILSHTADCQLLGVVEDTRSGGERTTTCHSRKEPVSGGEGTGGTMKATSQVPKWNCSPKCPCKLLDEQAEAASRFFKQIESE